MDSDYLIDSQNSALRSKVLSDYFIANRERLGTNKIVITGDITDSGDASDYAIAQAFIGKLKDNGFEVYCVPGNHDCSKEGTLFLGQQERGETVTRRANFDRYIDGARFPRFVNLHDGWLILLDSIQGELAGEGNDYCGQGLLGKAQLAHLKERLERLQAERRAGKKVIVCLHHSPFKVPDGDLPEDGSLSIHWSGGLGDAKEFLSVVANKIDCLLFGHTSSAGLLQQGHGSFKVQQAVYGIPMINCENLEHSPWYEELELSGRAKQVCMAANQDGRLEVVYIGLDMQLLHDWQIEPNGGWRGEETTAENMHGAWHGEQALGGQARQVCAGKGPDGRIEVFYIRPDWKIGHNGQAAPNGAWHGEETLAFQALEETGDGQQRICCEQNREGRLEVFFIGKDGQVHHVWQDDSSEPWNHEEVLSGQAKQVYVGRNEDGGLEVFYIGPDAKIWHNRQTTPHGPWQGGELLGPRPVLEFDDAAQQLSVARNKDGRLEVFYIGTDGEIFHNWQIEPNGTWHGEEGLGKFLENAGTQVCAAQNQDGRLEIFYPGTNSLIYHNYQTTLNGAWAGEELVRGLRDAARQICVGRNLDGRLEICYVGTNSNLYHNFQTVPNGLCPVTVIDMEHYRREVYLTNSPEPVEVTSEPH